LSKHKAESVNIYDAGKELSIHVCLSQAPAGKVNSVIRAKCLLRLNLSGAKWGDDVHPMG